MSNNFSSLCYSWEEYQSDEAGMMVASVSHDRHLELVYSQDPLPASRFDAQGRPLRQHPWTMQVIERPWSSNGSPTMPSPWGLKALADVFPDSIWVVRLNRQQLERTPRKPLRLTAAFFSGGLMCSQPLGRRIHEVLEPIWRRLRRSSRRSCGEDNLFIG